MARDYTDGHGWAKLDATAAHRLAETMCALRGRTADKRRDMLLWCYSRMSDGDPPTFRVGARTLAKACGVSHKSARLFLDFMDSEGWFVVTKEADDGLTDERTFWWFAEGTVPLEGHTPCRKPRSQGHTHCAPRHGSKGTHQMAEPSDNGYGSAIPSPPPSPAPAGAGPGGAGPDTYDEPAPPAPTPPPTVDDEWGGEW